MAALPTRRAMATKEYPDCGRAEPAGSPGDFLALHRRAAAGLGRARTERGTKERALRTVRALAEGSGAVAPRRLISKPPPMKKAAGQQPDRRTAQRLPRIVVAAVTALTTALALLCGAAAAPDSASKRGGTLEFA